MIRRNELEKLTSLAPQTFGNHILHLLKLKIINDKKIGKYKRGFYLNVDEDSQLVKDDEVQLIKKEVEKRSEYYDSWVPENTIMGLSSLAVLLELRMTQIWLKKQLPKANQERLEMQEQLVWTFNKTHRDFLRKSLTKITLEKQKELILQLDRRITNLDDKIFGQLKNSKT